MEKQEENNNKMSNLSFFYWKKRSFLLLIMLLILLSCKKTDAPDAGANSDASGANTNGASEVQSIKEDHRQSGRQVVLVRGNIWINGIPGFEDNSFPALSGEYRLQTASTGEEKIFTIYTSLSHLYFSKDWQTKPDTGNIQVFQRQNGDEFLAATTLDDGKGVIWTTVFRFPQGFEALMLSEESFNQMLQAWMGRFLYFLALVRTQKEISLPAVVEF